MSSDDESYSPSNSDSYSDDYTEYFSSSGEDTSNELIFED